MRMPTGDIRSTTNHELLQLHGDVVVGSYAENGVQLKESRLTLSGDELARHQKMFAQSASRFEGASLLPTPKAKKPGKTKKVAKRAVRDEIDIMAESEGLAVYEVDEPIIPTPVKVVTSKKKTIYLHNKLGKIRMQVEDVLDSEMAFALVFASDDDIVLTPQPGETLNFVDPQGDTYQVYFANTVFDWTDGIKRIMILFKQDDK